MGSGSYSINSSTGEYDDSIRYSNVRSRVKAGISADYLHASTHEIFSSRSMNDKMNPYDVALRESRDSEEHPNSLAIILALDVTGSMHTIPHYLIKKGLPNIMGSIIQRGIKDPQVMFMAIGDHECDSSPLQLGQFESSDELLDYWLENVYLEGGGGGNEGESYFLAWYFAATRTAIDCFEKRGEKGFLFTVGDEPVLKNIPASALQAIHGKGQYDMNNNTIAFLEKAREKYNVYHLHLKQGFNGNNPDVIAGWKQIMGDNLIVVEDKEDVAKFISEKITVKETAVEGQPKSETPGQESPNYHHL